MGNVRIEFVDASTVPAEKINYPGPFKNVRYEVMNNGHIRLTITKDLNLLTYDVQFAKKVSQLRDVQINIYETFGGTEYLIRSLRCNFINYILDQRPGPGDTTVHDEIIAWEVILIL